MSFQITSSDIHIEISDGTYLVANAQDESGNPQSSRIRLDDFIGNDDGHFQWGGAEFTQSAENINFSLEGAASQPVLRAQLKDREGNLHERDINLAERIENQDGRLTYI